MSEIIQARFSFFMLFLDKKNLLNGFKFPTQNTCFLTKESEVIEALSDYDLRDFFDAL